MSTARVRKSGSSLSASLPMIPLIDSASIRACAGSYTPQGRSQWAETSSVGANSRANMRVLSFFGCPSFDCDTTRVTGDARGVSSGEKRVPRLGSVRVRGISMTPTLIDGDRLLVSYRRAVEPGDLVVARMADGTVAVKRATERRTTRDGSPGWWLLSDN